MNVPLDFEDWFDEWRGYLLFSAEALGIIPHEDFEWDAFVESEYEDYLRRNR